MQEAAQRMLAIGGQRLSTLPAFLAQANGKRRETAILDVKLNAP
jgi:hypothetical protein